MSSEVPGYNAIRLAKEAGVKNNTVTNYGIASASIGMMRHISDERGRGVGVEKTVEYINDPSVDAINRMKDPSTRIGYLKVDYPNGDVDYVDLKKADVLHV